MKSELKLMFILYLFCIINYSYGLKREDCEVCFGVIEKVNAKLTDDHRKDHKLIEGVIIEYCATTSKSNHPDALKENQFCYYIGALEESATNTVRDVSHPLTYQFPVHKLCARLSSKIDGVCNLRYEKKIDLKNVDLKKLKVRDLKKILSQWGEDCEGCLEKIDFIKRIEALKPQYVKEEL